MSTIDKLDIGIYIQYAKRTQLIEQINAQYHFDLDSSIPPQIMLIDLYPKLTELDILLGIVPMATPWAYFFPPQNYRLIRRSPFAFSRFLPGLGSGSENGTWEDGINQVVCQTPQEEKEKEAITNCVKQIAKIKDWLGFIVGRVGQFLQG